VSDFEGPVHLAVRGNLTNDLSGVIVLKVRDCVLEKQE